jgi:hypothetical protein
MSVVKAMGDLVWGRENPCWIREALYIVQEVGQ